MASKLQETLVTVLMNDNYNAREIVRQLAISHPRLFLKLAGHDVPKKEPSLLEKAKKFYMSKENLCADNKSPSRVGLIKFVRTQTGWDLKKTKDWCDTNIPLSIGQHRLY